MTPPLPPVKTTPVRRAAPAIGRRVTKSLARLAEEAGVLDGAVIEQWAEIVGKDLYALCRPVRLKGGKGKGSGRTLVVAVPHGAAATMVEFRKKDIVARAAAVLGHGRVRGLAIEQPGGRALEARAEAMATERRGGRAGLRPGGGRWQTRRLGGEEAARAGDAKALPPAASVDEALERLRRSLGADGT